MRSPSALDRETVGWPLPVPPPQHGRPVVVDSVTIADPLTGELQPRRSVVIADRKIAAVAPAASVAAGGARVIDGRRLFLVPGLADMHVHLADVSESILYLANGVTTVRNMTGTPFHRHLGRRQEDGRWPGPRVVTVSPVLDGRGPPNRPFRGNAVVVDDPAGADRLVSRLYERGYRQIKAYSWLRPDVHAALGRACRRAGARLVGHCPMAMTWEEALAAGQTGFEHLTNITRGRLSPSAAATVFGSGTAPSALAGGPAAVRLQAAVDGIDLAGVERLAARLAESGVWVCPTLVVHEPVAARAGRDASLLRPDLRSAWDAAAAGAGDDALRRAQAAFLDLAVRITAILHRRGVPLLAGTDAPDPFIRPGFELHTELGLLGQAGLPPIDVLRTATVNPADFLGDARGGRVAPGCRGDVVLLRANPFEDVAALAEVDTVISNGFVFDRAALDAALEARSRHVTRSVQRRGGARASARRSDALIMRGSLIRNRGGEDEGDSRLDYVWERRMDGTHVIRETLRGFEHVTHRRVRLSVDGAVEGADASIGTPLGRMRLVYRSRPARLTVTWPDGSEETPEMPGGDHTAFLDEPFALTTWLVQARCGAGRGPHTVLIPPDVDREFLQFERALLLSQADDVVVKLSRNGGAAVRTYHCSADGRLVEIHEQSSDGAFRFG